MFLSFTMKRIYGTINYRPRMNWFLKQHFSSMVSYFGSVKSQLLIRDCNSRVETISIDLFSNGRNLQRVLRSEFGGELKNYSVRFGSKQVLCCKCATKCWLCLKAPSTLMCNFASFSMCFHRSLATLRQKIVTVLIAKDAIRKRSLK